jgi:DNA-binding transcriptional regulator PaaX
MNVETLIAKAVEELDRNAAAASGITERLAQDLKEEIERLEGCNWDLESSDEAHRALAKSLAAQLEEAKNELIEIEEKGLNI